MLEDFATSHNLQTVSRAFFLTKANKLLQLARYSNRFASQFGGNDDSFCPDEELYATSKVFRVTPNDLDLKQQFALFRHLQVYSKHVESINCDQNSDELLGEWWLVHIETERTLNLYVRGK